MKRYPILVTASIVMWVTGKNKADAFINAQNRPIDYYKHQLLDSTKLAIHVEKDDDGNEHF